MQDADADHASFRCHGDGYFPVLVELEERLNLHPSLGEALLSYEDNLI